MGKTQTKNAKPMNNAVEYLKSAQTEENIEDIYLDDMDINCLEGEVLEELNRMTDIICLSMNGCKLKTLANFPKFERLVRLELIENEFTGKDLVHLSQLKALQSLSLGCNAITEISELDPLSGLESLIQLDLSDCALAHTEGYREEVFRRFPKLQILDNKDNNGQEFEYSDSESGDFEGEMGSHDSEGDEDSEDLGDADLDYEEIESGDDDEDAEEGRDFDSQGEEVEGENENRKKLKK